MKLDLLKLIKKYGGLWVALNESSSEVLVSGKKVEVVYNKAKKKGFAIPKLFKVPTKHVPYIG